MESGQTEIVNGCASVMVGKLLLSSELPTSGVDQTRRDRQTDASNLEELPAISSAPYFVPPSLYTLTAHTRSPVAITTVATTTHNRYGYRKNRVDVI